MTNLQTQSKEASHIGCLVAHLHSSVSIRNQLNALDCKREWEENNENSSGGG